MVLAESQVKDGQNGEACKSLEEALLYQKGQNGEYNAKTSSVMAHLGQTYLLNEQFSLAIKNIEHACMISNALRGPYDKS